MVMEDDILLVMIRTTEVMLVCQCVFSNPDEICSLSLQNLHRLGDSDLRRVEKGCSPALEPF